MKKKTDKMLDTRESMKFSDELLMHVNWTTK